MAGRGTYRGLTVAQRKRLYKMANKARTPKSAWGMVKRAKSQGASKKTTKVLGDIAAKKTAWWKGYMAAKNAKFGRKKGK